MAGITEGRIVIVTGAGGGIGRGHALEFGRQGARVVVEEGWRPGPRAERDRRWEPAELGPVMRELLEQASAPLTMLDASG